MRRRRRNGGGGRCSGRCCTRGLWFPAVGEAHHGLLQPRRHRAQVCPVAVRSLSSGTCSIGRDVLEHQSGRTIGWWCC